MYTKCRVLSLINQLESLFWLIMFYFMLKWTKIVVMCKHPDPGPRPPRIVIRKYTVILRPWRAQNHNSSPVWSSELLFLIYSILYSVQLILVIQIYLCIYEAVLVLGSCCDQIKLFSPLIVSKPSKPRCPAILDVPVLQRLRGRSDVVCLVTSRAVNWTSRKFTVPGEDPLLVLSQLRIYQDTNMLNRG